MFHVNGTGRVRRRPWLAAPLLLSAAFPDPAGAQSEDTGVCDRTEQVRDAIAEAVLGVTDCADITATHLGQVTSLYLFAVNIGALKSGDFGGLTALDSLNLGFNDLRTLPADIFDGLASLEYLNLGHNELVLLPNSVFVGLTSLTTLLLGGNPGHPFGPIPEAGPRWNVRPDMEVSLSGSATDPWGRDVTYAWSQSDTSGATVSLDGANTATATLIAPALEKATLLEFTLTVVAVNPGGVRPVGTTAAGDTAQDVAGVNVRAAEPVTATFVQADYTATEGGAAATVGVRLNRIPERSVSIPLMATHAGGATEADYSIPASVTFAFADRVKYVTVTATDDTVDDNGESLTLGFGTLPPAVTAGSPSTVEVTLADNDRAVTGLAVTSDPGTDATYTLGDTIKVTATFGEAVTVTGQPQLTMRVGSAIQIAFGRADRAASYQSGSATDELVFAYVVAAGDTDPDGVSVADGSLSLNGGTLEYGGGTSAGLEHGALDEQTGHKVDAIAPTFVEAFVDGATLTLRFSKTLDEDSSPAGGVFAVTVGGTTRTVNAVGVDEKLVTLTLASPVVPADTVKVGYNAPTTSPIRDRAGFKAASFANKAVTNHTLPAVSIAAIDPAVYEGEDIDFRLTRTGRFAQSLRVGVRVEDGGDVLDGAAGDRYVTFGVGDTTAVLTVATLDDHAYEAHTTVTGTLFEVADYTISPTASAASVTVSDNDVPEIDILLEAADRVAEGAGDLEVRIIARTVADDEPHGSVTVRLRSTAGTATAGADGDFGEVNQTVRFAVSDFERVDEEGTANYVATLTHDVTIHDDTDEEDDETFTLRLSKLGGIQVDLNLPGEPLVVTIVDDDMVVRPGKVTGLSVTEGDEELVLSWTAVSGATGYKVQWKSGTETFADAATDGRQHVVSGGATTTSTIAGLTNGTQYATRVIATNSAGDGDASDERTGTPRAPVTTPGKVTGLSVTEGDEELVLSWTAVSGATGYKVQWKSGTETFADAATDGRQHVVSGGATTTSTIAGLTNGTQYATRVIATNSAGDGDASDERTGTPRAPVTTPGKVTGLSVTEGDEELVLSWTAVSGATGYKVQWKSGTETFADAATDGREHVVSGGATTTQTISGLTNGTQYATRVIATNSAGDGDASDERTGTPRAPVTTPGKVTGLSVTEGDEELVLSWTAVSGATGYKVQWKSGTETFADAATDGRQHVVSGGATTTSTISRPHERDAVCHAGHRDQLGGRRGRFGRAYGDAESAGDHTGQGDGALGDRRRRGVGPVLDRGERGHGVQGAVEVGHRDIRRRGNGWAGACGFRRGDDDADDQRPHERDAVCHAGHRDQLGGRRGRFGRAYGDAESAGDHTGQGDGALGDRRRRGVGPVLDRGERGHGVQGAVEVGHRDIRRRGNGWAGACGFRRGDDDADDQRPHERDAVCHAGHRDQLGGRRGRFGRAYGDAESAGDHTGQGDGALGDRRRRGVGPVLDRGERGHGVQGAVEVGHRDIRRCGNGWPTARGFRRGDHHLHHRRPHERDAVCHAGHRDQLGGRRGRFGRAYGDAESTGDHTRDPHYDIGDVPGRGRFEHLSGGSRERTHGPGDSHGGRLVGHGCLGRAYEFRFQRIELERMADCNGQGGAGRRTRGNA